ncbi:MAG: pyridoxamine 5'-phosphate oxidase family protein [Dehalococcoidia bacterium]|nr:pyridoxamine 5'-phosphate oxidase family protein [Dehalococcoidia bacterium]
METSRPHMPGYGVLPADEGAGLLPWAFAVERLARTRNYMLASVTPRAAPHVMPVWGVWLEDRFYFSTSPTSRKARNFAVNPRIVVTADDPRNAIIVEASVTALDDRAVARRVIAAYNAKYDWNTAEDEAFFVARPRVAFAFIETSDSESQFTQTATRWTFD